MAKSCKDCRHFEADEERDSDGYFLGSWAICNSRHGVSNLKQFPFRNTSCSEHETYRNHHDR